MKEVIRVSVAIAMAGSDFAAVVAHAQQVGVITFQPEGMLVKA